MRPMCIPCTLDEPFCPGPSLTIGKLPPLLLPSSLALWWDAVNEITQGDVNRIPGCTISNSGFTKADIAAVMALNALDSREEIGDGSYYERALFMVLLLKDGRFGLVCEGSYIDSIRSHMYVRTSVWVAPTLHDLVYFALGDKERRILSVSILPFDDYPSAENLHFSTRYKKVKPHRRQVEHGDKSYHLEIAEPQGYTLDTWLDHAITQQDIAPDQSSRTHGHS
ncbi:hypothetical protein Pelo_18992 [Pelomyxa schiedti]|nr:hypothetical protein Pelo_18992 [Pelomyxa schiedti]